MIYNKNIFFLVFAFLIMSSNVFFSKASSNLHEVKINTTNSNDESAAEQLYRQLQSSEFDLPKLESFKLALQGFYRLQSQGLIQSNIITLIDFSLSANVKRLWVIDLNSETILLHSLVAHGKNSGQEYANDFSNAAESYKSSLGFYCTAEVYNGKHGKSLRLDGLEPGINDNARNRAVVVHGASYVSDSFIKNNKRLGRSLGCPAVPVEVADALIGTIKNKSCLFIYYPSESYKRSSELI